MSRRQSTAPPAGAGRLFLVVGPSGAGKDSLIGEARRRLGDEERFVFPRRVITRPAQAGSEDFVSATVEEFEAQARDGAFALHWRSHGLLYGIPAAVDVLVSGERRVVVNVSRTVVDAARARCAQTRVIQVVAPPAVVIERLTARGRETADDIARRIDRAARLTVSGRDVATVDNSGPLAPAAARFVGILQAD